VQASRSFSEAFTEADARANVNRLPFSPDPAQSVAAELNVADERIAATALLYMPGLMLSTCQNEKGQLPAVRTSISTASECCAAGRP
jgi:hypothetical protein